VTVLLQRDRNLWAWQNCGCGSGEPVPFRRLRDLPPSGGARGLISFSLGSRAGPNLGDPEVAGSESIEAW